MAGSLIKIDEEIVSGAVSSVSLTGINSNFDVYMVKMSDVQTDDSGITYVQARVTTSGTADTTANYDSADKNLRTDTTFSNSAFTNQTFAYIANAINNSAQSTHNNILYLFNFNNASEYSFATFEGNEWRYNDNNLFGRQGGFVHTVAQSCDGINIFTSAGNIDNGTFTLYGLKK